MFALWRGASICTVTDPQTTTLTLNDHLAALSLLEASLRGGFGFFSHPDITKHFNSFRGLEITGTALGDSTALVRPLVSELMPCSDGTTWNIDRINYRIDFILSKRLSAGTVFARSRVKEAVRRETPWIFAVTDSGSRTLSVDNHLTAESLLEDSIRGGRFFFDHPDITRHFTTYKGVEVLGTSIDGLPALVGQRLSELRPHVGGATWDLGVINARIDWWRSKTSRAARRSAKPATIFMQRGDASSDISDDEVGYLLSCADADMWCLDYALADSSHPESGEDDKSSSESEDTDDDQEISSEAEDGMKDTEEESAADYPSYEDGESEICNMIAKASSAYDELDSIIVLVSVEWVFKWQSANLFTINYKNRSLFVGLVLHDRRCVFSFSLGMFLPNYKAFVRKKSDRQKDLSILRKLKHKEKKLVKKKSQKIRWKSLKRSKSTRRFMLRYARYTLIRLRLKSSKMYVRGYPVGLRSVIRELFKKSKVDELVYKHHRAPRWVTVEFYNKYTHELTERSIKKRVKKKLTAKRNRRLKIRPFRGERKSTWQAGKMRRLDKNIRPKKYDNLLETVAAEETKIREHPLVIRRRRTRIKTRRGDILAKRELRRGRWRRTRRAIFGQLRLRVIAGKKRVELRDAIRRYKKLFE